MAGLCLVDGNSSLNLIVQPADGGSNLVKIESKAVRNISVRKTEVDLV
jgi:hypothetical protein